MATDPVNRSETNQNILEMSIKQTPQDSDTQYTVAGLKSYEAISNAVSFVIAMTSA